MPLPQDNSSGELDSYTAFPTNFNPQDTHLRATIQKIDELVQDVEMQAPLSERSAYLVVDTNILLQHFDVFRQFVEDAERYKQPVIVVIPGVVIYELDGQKNRDGLAWFARRASAWLLRKVKERTIVKGQANEETCKASRNWKIKDPGEILLERRNDALIVDCCLYFWRIQRRTFLCSADKLLCFDSEKEGISTISPFGTWSSQSILSALVGEKFGDVKYFGKYQASYRDPKTNPSTVVSLEVDDEDKMEVDDEGTDLPEVLPPSHALDLLHIQVIEHFTSLLVDLVGRVGGPEIHDSYYASEEGTLASRYAPQWRTQKRPYLEWTTQEALEYLADKKRMKPTSPRLEVFLSRPYLRGARRGQDWSRRDWEVGLGALEAVGEQWEEVSIGESLRVLRGHVDGIFALKLRPTGTVL